MATNDAINLNQLKQSVFNMKNYMDSKIPITNDSEKYILRKTIVENINFDDSDIITTTMNYISVIKNLEISNETLSKEYIGIKIESDNGITFNKDMTEYFINGTTTIISDNKTLDIDSKRIQFILTFNRKAIGLDENGNSTFEANNNYCTLIIRSLEAGKHPLNDYNRSKNWTLTLVYYDINSKYYQKMYNIPVNIEDGVAIGSIQQKGNTSTGIFALGSKNTGKGFLLGASNASENSSCIFGKGNTTVGTFPGYFFGEGNKSHDSGGGFTVGTNNNTEGISIAVGRKLTTNIPKNTNKGAMIIGQCGTLSQDSRFTISTGNSDGGDIRYPFDAKDNGDTYLRGKNVFLETDNEPTEDNHLISKKYVDNKVAGIVNSAPETLDTLNELAEALGNDPNFATTVATQIGNKVDKEDGKTLTTNDLTNDLKANYDAAYAYTQAKHSYNDLSDLPTIPSIEGLASEETLINNTLNFYIGTKENPIILNEIKNGWFVVDGYYKWYSAYNNPIMVSKALMHKSPLTGSNCIITYMNGSTLTRYIVKDNNVNPGSAYALTGSVLTLNNTTEYTPTSDYHPTTKKYVDNKKYNDLIEKPIIILPYETSVSNGITYKNSIINVATLEGNKIYMTAPDVTNLFLQVENLDGTLMTHILFLGKTSGSTLIHTGAKNDKKIEVIIEGGIYTFYFKTDTEDAKVEKSIRYLSDKNTIKYTPTGDYDPATKKYADDIKASIVVPTKTSELTNDSNFLTEHQSLDGYAKTSDIPSIDGLATEEFVNNKITKKLVSPSNDGDIYLTADEYQYLDGIVAGSSSSSSLIWLPYNDLPDFTKIHLYILNSSMPMSFDTLVLWKNNELKDNHFDPIKDNSYEVILTYINKTWIGEFNVYTKGSSDTAADDEVKNAINDILGGDYVE